MKSSNTFKQAVFALSVYARAPKNVHVLFIRLLKSQRATVPLPLSIPIQTYN